MRRWRQGRMKVGSFGMDCSILCDIPPFCFAGGELDVVFRMRGPIYKCCCACALHIF